MGAAYAAGISLGIYNREELFGKTERTEYKTQMNENEYRTKYDGWTAAVSKVLNS